MNKIPPTNKTKILVDTKEDLEKDHDEDDGEFDDVSYYEEKEAEYLEATLLALQQNLLNHVNRKSLTLCEYLSVESISKYLGYS